MFIYPFYTGFCLVLRLKQTLATIPQTFTLFFLIIRVKEAFFFTLGKGHYYAFTNTDIFSFLFL